MKPAAWNKYPLLFPLMVLGLLAGCGQKAEEAAPASAPAFESTPLARQMEQGDAVQADAPAGPEQPRYLAERQYWVFELPEDAIEKRWQSHVALCRNDCIVLHAGLNKSRQTPVSATLQIRVGRASAGALLARLEDPAVSERRVEREDRTLQVVDMEARLKNLAELRDRLRGLLKERAGSLKDVLETERELARVQGELDAMASQRKVLAEETEKIFLQLDYRAIPGIAQTGALHPVKDAWGRAGSAFSESLAAALLFIVTVLPWLVLVVPLLWGAWKLFRRLFRRRGATEGTSVR